jgi:spermidine synthase
MLRLLFIGIGISGATSMIYEVAWTRALTLIIGSSVYAFSAMLTTFLVGLALGSFIFARAWGKKTSNGSLFGFLELGIGFSALALVLAFDKIPDVLLRLVRIAPESHWVTLLSQFCTSFLLMILPVTLIGAAFPCVVHVVTTQVSRLGRQVGTVYSANSAGTALGAIGAGLLLIPVFGVQFSIAAASAVNALLGIVILLACGKPLQKRAAVALLCLFAGALVLFPRWDKNVMTAGPSVYAMRFVRSEDPAISFRNQAAQRAVVFYEEGINSTISVEKTDQSTALRVNGKADASDGIDMLTQLTLGHLPMLLHPRPERALVIGLGSGVTAGAMTRHAVLKNLDIVELEPAMARAAHFFTHVNHNVLQDPRTSVVLADARNFLLATDKKYDVISSEPSNPWMAGVANLFSREFYQLARQRLAKNGLMAQWVHGYSLFPRELRMVINTFRTVFPHTTVWWTIEGDYLLVGTNQRLVIDYNVVNSRYSSSRAVQDDFRLLGWQSPLAVLTLFLLGEQDTARVAAGMPLNTDDRPLLEFFAPLALYADTMEKNHQMLKAARTEEGFPIRGLDDGDLWTAENRLLFARAFWARGDRPAAVEQIRHLDSSSSLAPPLVMEKARLLFALGSVQDAMQELVSLSGRGSNPQLIESYLKVGRFLQARGLEGTLPLHGRTEAGNPDPAEAHNSLGLFYVSAGIRMREPAMFDLAVDSFKAAMQLAPQAYPFLNNLANAYFEQGRFDEAAENYRRVLELKPNLFGTRFNLALVYEKEGALELATRELETAIRLKPDWMLPRIHLAQLTKRDADGDQGRSVSKSNLLSR